MGLTGLLRDVSREARKNRDYRWFLTAALAIAIAAAVPLFTNTGLLNTRGGGDSPFLLQRLHQLVTAVADGHFPVRWMPDANYGFGYPFFNFYAPLSIYIAALFDFIGGDMVLAIKLTQLAGFVVAGWAMFTLVRSWTADNWAALLASAAYTLAPFHMVNVYVRGDSLAEFWAMAFYPLTLLAADGLASSLKSARRSSFSDRMRSALFLSLAYAGLVTSHNISALIFTPFLLLYLLLALYHQVGDGSVLDRVTGILPAARWPAIALLVGLLLSAWFWLPALAERDLAQLGPVTSGYFHFSNHFRLGDLVQRSFLFNYDVAGGRAFAMGLVQALVMIPGAAALFIYARRSGSGLQAPFIFALVALVVATLMITPASRWLWEYVPLLNYTQFPWRFLSVQALVAAAAASGLALLPGRRWLTVLAAGLLLLSSLGDLPSDFLNISGADVTPERLAQYEWFTGNIGSTVSAEYLPPSVETRPYTSSWLVEGNRDDARSLNGTLSSAELLQRRADQQEWRMDGGAEGATVILPTIYWPGWKAEVDGAEIPITAAQGSGLITVPVPAGLHEISLHLSRTPVRLWSELASLIAALLTITYLVAQNRPGRRALIVPLLLVILVLALRLVQPEEISNETSNWDFSQLAYLQNSPYGVQYDNGLVLESYGYLSDKISAGDTFTLRASWLGEAVGETVVELVTPASTRHNGAPVIASALAIGSDGQVTYELHVPKNAPAGLMVPRIRVNGAKPLLASGQTRGELYLQPVRVVDLTESAREGKILLDARPTHILVDGARVLRVELQWFTAEQLSHNYHYSLRLNDNRGNILSQSDHQPGYGYLPSSGWEANLWIDDWPTLPLGDIPEILNTLPLTIQLYDASSGRVVLTRRLAEMTNLNGQLTVAEPAGLTTLPESAVVTEVNFDNAIALIGYDLTAGDEELSLVLYWQALVRPDQDYFHFVHLVDSASGQIVAQHDSMPQYNTFPTSQWRSGEIIADQLTLSLSEAAAGEYDLYAGLYEIARDVAVNLEIVSHAGGQVDQNQRYLLARDIIVE